MPNRMVIRKAALIALATCIAGGYAMAQHVKVSPHVISGLHAERWQVRRDAFEHLPCHPKDSQLDSLLIQLRFRENRASEYDPDDLFEDDDYLAYDERLTNCIEQIAVTKNCKDAWRSLVYMRYNGDSATGRWLADHPETLPFLLEQTRSRSSFQRMTAVYVIAAYAAKAKAKKAVSPQKYQSLRQLVRKLAVHDELPVRDAAVEGLGVLGDPADLPLLEQIGANDKDQYVRSFALASAKSIKGGTTPETLRRE